MSSFCPTCGNPITNMSKVVNSNEMLNTPRDNNDTQDTNVRAKRGGDAEKGRAEAERRFGARANTA